MYNKDDSIVYNLTIKNNSDDDIELSNKFSSDSEYIEYKIEDSNLIVEKGKEKTFKLSATYTKEVDVVLLSNGTIEDNQVMNLSITTKEENPNTSATNIAIMIAILILAILTIVLSVKSVRATPKYMSLLIIPILVIPVVVYALTKFELKLEAKVVIGEHKERIIDIKDVQPTYVCKKATTLHTATCNNNDTRALCGSLLGYGNTTTFGTIPDGEPKAGDAYDCDVNNDGVYDSETERFYYVSSTDATVSLIYYKDVTMRVQYGKAYDIQFGPRVAGNSLPDGTTWSNPKLHVFNKRRVTTENGTTTLSNGTTETIFSYGLLNHENGFKVARFLTTQEIDEITGIDYHQRKNPSSIEYGNELADYNFLIENTRYYDYNETASTGYWLENIHSTDNNKAWNISSLGSIGYLANTNENNGVRPVITIDKVYLEEDYNSTSQNVIYPSGKNKSTVEEGDIVKIADEEFYVIGREEEDLVLLSRYVLNVCNNPEYSGIQTNYTTEEAASNITYGYALLEYYAIFTETSYWKDKVGKRLEYPGSYEEKDYPYVYDSNSDLYPYVLNYKMYLNTITPIKKIRLMTYKEAMHLEETNQAILRETKDFWLGNASEEDGLWISGENGTTQTKIKVPIPNHPDRLFTFSTGIRPVIII